MASSSTGLSDNQVSDLQLSGDYAIKSEATTPKLGMRNFRLVLNVVLMRRHFAMAFVAEELRQTARPIIPLHPHPFRTSGFCTAAGRANV